MKVMVTGHRPDKIGGYDKNNPTRLWIKSAIKFTLRESIPLIENIELENIECISGMAIGIDQDYVDVTLYEMLLKVHAYIPGKFQPNKWPKESKDYYFQQLKDIKENNESIVLCNDTPDYKPYLLHERNQRMVDDCDIAIAVWDGSDGGTHDAVKRLDRARKTVYRIDPATHTVFGPMKKG